MSTTKNIVKTATSTAGAAVAGPIGSAIGGALGTVIGAAFGGSNTTPTTLGQASPEVQAWFADTGGTQFKDWLTANKPEAYAWTVDQILPLFYAFLLNSGRSIGWWTRNAGLKDPRAYRPGLTEQAYAALGVDYAASAAAWEEAQRTGARAEYVMLPSGGTPKVPAVAVAALDAIAAKVRNGQPLTADEQRTWNATNKAAGAGGGGGIDLTTVLVIVAAVAVIYVATR